nr:hypothetical protein CFP56_56274 [Quercus suber]
MVDDVDDEQAVKVVTIAWALWNNWNVVGEKNGKALVQWAMNYIMEYNEAVAVSKESTQVAEFADPWRPPQASCTIHNCADVVAETQNGKATEEGNLLGSSMVYEDVSFSSSSMARFSARRMDSAAHVLGEESRDELFGRFCPHKIDFNTMGIPRGYDKEAIRSY